MGHSKIIFAIIACLGLSACMDNDLERAAVGAGVGAAGAAATGGNVVTGAAVGGAAGALCDDILPGLCR